MRQNRPSTFFFAGPHTHSSINPHEVRQIRTVLSQTAHLSTCGGCHPLPGFCKPLPRAHAPAVSGEGNWGRRKADRANSNTNQLWIIMLVGAAVHVGRSQCSSMTVYTGKGGGWIPHAVLPCGFRCLPSSRAWTCSFLYQRRPP